MKLRYYDTATARYQRSLEGQVAKTSICVDTRLMPHLLGFLNTLSPQFDASEQEEVDELVSDVFESALLKTPCGNYGAAFQMDEAQARNLEVQQGVDVGLPAPWEFMIGN